MLFITKRLTLECLWEQLKHVNDYVKFELGVWQEREQTIIL